MKTKKRGSTVRTMGRVTIMLPDSTQEHESSSKYKHLKEHKGKDDHKSSCLCENCQHSLKLKAKEKKENKKKCEDEKKNYAYFELLDSDSTCNSDESDSST